MGRSPPVSELDGFIYGLAAALGWGFGDLSAAVSTRRIGTVRTAAGSLFVGLCALVVFAVATGVRLPTDPAWFARVIALGAIASLSALAFWQSLRLGPITVVGPIGSTVGAVTVILAVIFVPDDPPNAVQWLAVPVAALGSVLAAVVFGASTRGGTRRVSLVGLGPIFAVGSIVSFAFYTVALSGPIREAGWAATLLVTRFTSVTVTWAFTGAILVRARRSGILRSQADRRPIDRRSAGLLIAVGLLGLAAVGALTAGLERAPVWLVGLVSSSGSVVMIVGGLVLFRERLRGSQWVGIGLVGVALVLLAIGPLIDPG
jgi:drug/metabolite transporter (DMT)-like permease